MRYCLTLSFLINLGVFFSYSQVNSKQVPDEIKESLIEGHLETCVPTIKSQLEQGYSTSKIKRYCYCLGNAYFNEFSFKDYDYLSKYLKLPPRIDNIRYKLQINCGDKYLE